MKDTPSACCGEDSFTLPAAINGTPFVPGPVKVNSITEKWGIYYPNSSGIPFTVFYKTPTDQSSSSAARAFTKALYLTTIGGVSELQRWKTFPIFDDYYLSTDDYPKGLRIKFRSLIDMD